MTTPHVSPAWRASETETSDISMTPIAIFHHLDASDAVMTLSAIPLRHEGPDLASLSFASDEAGASPHSRPLLRDIRRNIIDFNYSRGPELHHIVDPSCETFKGISQISIIAEVPLS
jgi:hypothetical protein